MKIAILGTGRCATRLARRLSEHDLVFGTCEYSVNLTRRLVARMGRRVKLTSPKDAVRQAQVVLLAATDYELPRLLSAAGPFAGKLVLQASDFARSRSDSAERVDCLAATAQAAG